MKTTTADTGEATEGRTGSQKTLYLNNRLIEVSEKIRRGRKIKSLSAYLNSLMEREEQRERDRLRKKGVAA
jgi:hypothetical protein